MWKLSAMRIRLWLIVILSGLLSACSNRGWQAEALDAVADYMQQYPDSALIQIKKIKKESLRGRYNKARYALLYSQALDKNFIDIESDSLISEALQYYRRRGLRTEQAYAFYYSGRIYENRNNIDSAIIQYSHTEKYLQGSDNNHLLGLTANALARLYQQQNFIELSKEKYIDAANSFIQGGNKLNALYSYIGAISMSAILENYDEVDSYYQVAYDLAEELCDTTQLLNLAKVKAASIIDKTGDYRECIEVLNSAVANYNHGIVPRDYYSIMGNCYLRLGKPDSAFLYTYPRLDAASSSRAQLETHYMLSQIYDAKQEYRKAYEHGLRALTLSDSLYFAEKEIALPELHAKYRNEQLALHNSYLNRINRYQLYIGCILLLTVLVICLWLINRRQNHILRQEKEISEYRDVIFRLRDEYESLRQSKQNDADANIETINRRIAFLKQILETTAQFGHNKEAFYARIEQLLSKNGTNNRNSNGASEILQIFQDIMNARNAGFIDALKNRYPELSNQEIGLYCMISMGLSKSAICMVMNISAKSLYNYRNILRQKIRITNADITIEQHYHALCEELINDR